MQAPFGAEVIRVNPSQVRFSLERTLSKTVAVVPTMQGQPADGFELGQVMVSPGRFDVEGPESRMNVAGVHCNGSHSTWIGKRDRPSSKRSDLDVPDPQLRLQRPISQMSV